MPPKSVMLSTYRADLPTPIFQEAGHQTLCLESTLGELSLQHFQVEAALLGSEVAAVFEEYSQLSGVTLQDGNRFLGMISRQRLLEYLIRPHGVELFLSNPLKVLHSYSRCKPLILPDRTPIVVAAQRALRRSPDQRYEPIVVAINDHTFYLLDIHELHIAYWQIRGIETQVRLERIQAQMIQSEKMAGLGRLVDGVAHEILDPVGFIWGNLTHISAYTSQLLELLDAYEAQLPNPPEAIANLRHELELDYIRHDLPRTIDSVRGGAERLRKLAASLQNFCHIDNVYPKPADLHECLDSIILLLKSRLTGEIEIVKHYGHLPPVSCFIGQLSQVFMNILTNAVDVILNQAIYQEWTGKFGDRPETVCPLSVPKPQITITTQVRSLPQADSSTSRWVSIRIIDNGPGLTSAQRKRILESFSVEKRAAKETSLAVSYRIITAKHGGKLHLRSPAVSQFGIDSESSEPVLDRGTEFEILLPLE